MAALNGFDVQGRKLRVEYKKVLQAGEKERIEREKAIRRMRSMQMEKERQEQEQRMLQATNSGNMGSPYEELYSPFSGPPMLPGSRSFAGSVSIQNPNPFAVQSMPVPQPFVHPGQQAPSPAPPLSGPPSSASVQKPLTGQTELDLNDPATLEIYSRVLLFKDDHMRDELAFARSLSPKQRRIVHLVAQKLGVYHYSVGEGDERYAVVTRHAPADRQRAADAENGRGASNASDAVQSRMGPVRHHSSQALNRSYIVGSASGGGGATGSLFSNSPSYSQNGTGDSPTSTTPVGGLRSKKSMPDMKTSIYTPTPRLTTRTSSGNMREGASGFSGYAALRRQTSGVIPPLGQIFGSHVTGNNMARASVSGAIGDRPMAGLNGHPTDGTPPVPALPSTPENGPPGASAGTGVVRQPRGPGTTSGGNFARRRESAIGPLDRAGSSSGLDARTHEPLEI